jgi:hypothetical protein
LYASTLIATWQRLISLNISWDFDVLCKVIRKRGMYTVAVPSAGDRRLVDFCLTLITSKARFTNQSEMYPAGAAGFWGLGHRVKLWEVIVLEASVNG